MNVGFQKRKNPRLAGCFTFLGSFLAFDQEWARRQGHSINGQNPNVNPKIKHLLFNTSEPSTRTNVIKTRPSTGVLFISNKVYSKKIVKIAVTDYATSKNYFAKRINGREAIKVQRARARKRKRGI